MRLAPGEVATIKRLVTATYGAGAIVRLFGSQLDDTRRGGDIDLMVEVDDAEGDLCREQRLQRDLEAALGERRVDLIVQPRHRPDGPMANLARTRGQVL